MNFRVPMQAFLVVRVFFFREKEEKS